MSGISTSDRLAALLTPFRARLAEADRPHADEADRGDDSAVVERLRELLTSADREGVVFQSIIVACLQTVVRVRRREQLVQRASISLAQRQKLDALLQELEAVEQHLDAALSTQGRRMMDLSRDRGRPEKETRWWYALSEAIHELEEGTECMASLVGNQPRGTEVRRLAGTIVRLLHKHHAQLVQEAEEWMA